ncbi:MAG: hypothetical protein U0637_12290 [Phycisphaerales bacterium]
MRSRLLQLLIAAGAASGAGPARGQDAAPADGGPVIVGENKSHWRAFDLHQFKAALDFMGRHRSQTQKQDGLADVTDTETILREFVEFSGEAYIGHKNLIDLTGNVRLGVEDRFLDSGTLQSEDHAGDLTDLFDLNAHVLGSSKVPVDVFTRREENFLDQDFAGSVTSTTFETGIAATLQSERAPTTLRLFRLETNQDNPLGQYDYSQDQNSFLLHSNIALTKSNRLEVEYTFDNISEAQGTGYRNAYDRHNLQLTDVYNFGKLRDSELRSYLRYYEETGRFPQRSLRWDEQLTLIHSRRLETRYNTSVEHRTQGGADQDQQEASATIKHRLFESLVSTATAGARHSADSGDFSSSEWYVNGDLNYTKRVPRGRLNITLGGSFNAQDNSERGAATHVSNESQVFNDPLPITLARRHIVPGSVEVRGAGGFPLYDEGVHYTVQYFQDRAEVRITLGSGISDGDILLVSYDVGPEPASTVDTTGLTASIRYTLTEGWLEGLSAYSIYRRTDHSVSTADPAILVFDDASTFTYGVEYRRGGWHGLAEREHHESTVSPYNTTRLEGAYDHQFGSGSILGIDGSYENIRFENPANTLDYARLSFRYNDKLSTSTDVLLRLDLRDESDSLRGDSQGVDALVTLNWRRRQTTAYVTVRDTLVQSDTSERDELFVEVGVRREF